MIDKKLEKAFDTSSNILENDFSPTRLVTTDKTLNPSENTIIVTSGTKILKTIIIIEQTPTAFLIKTEQL